MIRTTMNNVKFNMNQNLIVNREIFTSVSVGC